MGNIIQTINKSFVLITAIMILSSLVFAQGIQAPGDDSGNARNGIWNDNTKNELRNNNTGNRIWNNYTKNGTDQQINITQQIKNLREIHRIQIKEQTKTRIAKIKQAIQQKKQQMDKEIEKTGNKKQQILKNQNRLRLAVHSLLAIENLTGGIGPQVREIARNFNNSVKTTITAEEKIQTRWGLTKFFFGGDAEAAEKIETEVNKNQQRIQKLKQLREQCNCSEEVKTIMQEQIQQMMQEQIRLKKLAQSEKKNKGILGWLWK